MKYDKENPAIGIQQDGGVLIFTLTKPERLNAWDTPMRARLGDLLEQADADPQVRAIVLTGAGERSFCAGADLKEQSRFSTEFASHEERAHKSMAHWRVFYRQILNVGKPLVVALNGLAAGSAFQVAMMADFRVVHPSISGTTLMMRRLGSAVAAEFALSGRLMEAEEAQRHGLISRMVPASDVLQEAIALAREMGERSPVAFRQTKAWLHQPELRDLDAAFDFAEKANVAALRDGDMVQRLAAFATKHAGHA
jgi:enoyl-CoA hydratase